MAIFYKKTDFQHETVVEYPAWPYIATTALLPLMVLSLVVQQKTHSAMFLDIVFFLLIGLTLGRLIGQWNINKEVREAMKEGKVTMTGSRYSIKNPIKITIKK